MKNNLVTSGIEETFDQNNNNIILGEWCLRDFNEISKFKTKKIKFHWESSEKKKRDYDYLEDLYYRILNSLVESLNNYHSVKKNQRYWHIIIGPFLLNVLQILWDKWESVNYALDNEKINETRIIKVKDQDLVPLDFKEFFLEKNNHFLNHIIYSEIINFLQPKSLKIINIKYKKSFAYNNSNFNYKKKFSIKKMADFILKLIFKNKIVFYKNNIVKENLIKLNIKLNQIPRLYYELDQNIEIEKNLQRNNFEIKFVEKNNFEKFLRKKLTKLIPISYLEGYEYILKKTNKIKLNPKIICTAMGHTIDDFFKVWSAEKVEKGTKYIVTDHGGYIDDKQNFSSWSNFSDTYLRWNYKDEKNILQISPGILFKKYKPISLKNRKLLLIAGTANLYPNKIQSAPISQEILEDVKNWKKLYENLQIDMKKVFKIRTHPSDPWKIKEDLIKKYGKKIISTEKKFEKDVESSKFIINTNFSTSFFETMHSGVPNIILAKQSYFYLSDKKKDFLKGLLENNVLFEDPIKAHIHLKNIWMDPLEWWNSEKIIEIKKRFHDLCFIKNDDYLNTWKNHFVSELKK